MPPFAVLGPIITEIIKLASLIFQHSNTPEMAANKLNDFHQALEDQNEKLATTMQAPGLTAAQKQSALDQVRLADS